MIKRRWSALLMAAVLGLGFDAVPVPAGETENIPSEMADATSPASKHSLKESGATMIFIYSRIQQGHETEQGAPMVEGVATAAVTSITGYRVPVLVDITFFVPPLQHQPNGLVDESFAH